MIEQALTSARSAAGVVRRLSFLLPVAIFGIVAVGLGVGLTRNPQEIPSALIGKPVPEFAPAAAISMQAVAAEAPTGFAMHESPRPVPEIRFENGEGEARSLADFRGKVVLLNIWATWCAPCRREMPTLDRLQAELGGPDFEVVALSIDRKGLPAVQEFYQEIGLETLPIYVDPSGKSQRQLSVLGIPTTLLLDREGNEIGRLAGPAEWDGPEMITFIRSVVERRSGGVPGPAGDQLHLASLHDRPAVAGHVHLIPRHSLTFQ